MKITQSLTVLGFALALGAGLVPALAQDAPPPPAPAKQDGMRDWSQGRMAEQLKLTDTQKASLKTIMAKHHDALSAKGKAAKEARRAFFEAMQKPETSPETLKALHRTMSDAGFEQLLEGRTMRQEIRAMLTPDQREQAARMEGRREGMRMARGGFGFGGMMHGGHHGPQGPQAPAPVPAS
jgi:Spy/CpxP family protein refolding chaperone